VLRHSDYYDNALESRPPDVKFSIELGGSNLRRRSEPPPIRRQLAHEPTGKGRIRGVHTHRNRRPAGSQDMEEPRPPMNWLTVAIVAWLLPAVVFLCSVLVIKASAACSAMLNALRRRGVRRSTRDDHKGSTNQ
jgi:hypothetical protein